MQIFEKAHSSTKKQCIFGFLRKYEKSRTIRQASAQLCGIIFENRATYATMAAMTQNATRHTTVITEQTPEARV